MDDGRYFGTPPFSICFWLPGSPCKLAMGFRNRVLVRAFCLIPHCFLYERIVSQKPTCASTYRVILFSVSMYHRDGTPNPSPSQKSGFWSHVKDRIWLLVGITGVKNATPNPTWTEVIWAPIHVLLRPHMFLILVFEVYWIYCLQVFN
jgi:hypothetical protein